MVRGWVGLVFIVAGCAAPSDPEDSGAGSTSVSDGPVTDDDDDDDVEPSDGSGSTGDPDSGDDDDDDDNDDDDDDDDTTGGPPIELDCEGSVLAELVADLPARAWATMPDNASLDALEMTSSLLYWNDSAVWNPNARRLQWVGGPGTCCADPAQYRLMTYEELTDTWTIEDTPFIGSGHAYDGNAMDPETGEHFFALYNDEVVHRYADGAWDDLPPIPFDAQATMGLTWFDDMDGLVYVGGFGNLAWYDGASWTELSIGEGEPWGSYNTFAEHSASHGLVWVGAGNGADRVNYVVGANGSMTRGTDAPISLNNGQTIKSVDPISGRFLVGDTEAGQWWEYDPIGDVWTEIDDMIDLPSMASRSVFHVPLPHCGVTLFFGHYWDERDVWLYRHSPV